MERKEEQNKYDTKRRLKKKGENVRGQRQEEERGHASTVKEKREEKRLKEDVRTGREREENQRKRDKEVYTRRCRGETC